MRQDRVLAANTERRMARIFRSILCPSGIYMWKDQKQDRLDASPEEGENGFSFGKQYLMGGVLRTIFTSQ